MLHTSHLRLRFTNCKNIILFKKYVFQQKNILVNINHFSFVWWNNLVKKIESKKTREREKAHSLWALEAFYVEINDGTLCEASTTLLTMLHKCDSSTGAVITHFTTLILIMWNVNIHIIDINAENNVVICNYRLALIFFFQRNHTQLI